MGHRHSSLRSFALGVFVTLISLLALRSREALAQGSCVTLENQLKGLEAGQARLQKDLQRAAGEDKQSLVQQIKELESEIRQKQAELIKDKCKGVVTWNVAGRNREALVFPPTTDLAMKHPLIFAWHGHGGNMNNAAESMHFQTLWPAAIVVYPQGLKTETERDPNGNAYGWQKENGQDDNRDLKFFDAMLATLQKKYSIDDTRIYTTGFSNGTGFSYLLWAERGQTLAAIGAVAGVLADSEQERLMKPGALIAIFGMGDGTASEEVKEKTIRRARDVNGTASGQPCPAPNEAPSDTKCVIYPSPTNTPVRKVSHPGGHVYPPWAPDEIVKFFKNHRWQ